MDVSPSLRTLQQNDQEEVSDRGKDRGSKRPEGGGQAGEAGSPSASTAASAPATSTNFEGIGQGFTGPAGTFGVQYAPPDPNGAVGPNHYIETVNVSFAIFNRSGTPLYGPVKINTLWSGFGGGCQTDNDGDPSVIYDRIADRWLISQFAVTTTKYLNCLAVSKTPDPLGAYARYSYAYTDFPDYPKFGLWPDGYYVSFNMFAGGSRFNGAKACSYDRVKMIAGQPAPAQVCFSAINSSLLPSTLDGARLPPVGSPNYLVALGTTAATLAWWKFHVDWATPLNSTFTGPTSLTVPSYAMPCGGGGACIPQPGTSQQLDSLGDRLMYRLAYRNLGDHEALVVNHAVTASGSVGIRWYELRIASGALSLFQQGTYAPDATSRWMGSIAMDQAGDIALGYSASSSSVNPSIRYTGRLAADPANTMAQGEATIIAGGGSQFDPDGSLLSRWGDYTSMAIDPLDDCTFWYTNEYLKADGTFNWSTRIGTFKFANCLSVTGVTPTSGPIGGGTAVTITGTGFAGAANVSLAGVAATGVSVVSPTSITATSPAHPAGAVDVTVTNPDTQSGTCGRCFTYRDPPTVTAINPSGGPAAGGTSVAITGGGFDSTAGATTVRFGSTPATGVSCSSTTSCVAASPAGSGTVDVTVTVGGQTSPTSPADAFTYVTSALAASYSSTPPTSWLTKQTQTYSITLTNTGSQTWNATGTNAVYLGVQFGTADDTPYVGWATDQYYALPADVAPAGSVTLSVAVTAPGAAGTFVLRHRMLKDHVAWFDQIQKTNVTVS
jgi:hypothetical protein